MAQADSNDDGFLTDKDDQKYDLLLMDFFAEPHESDSYIDEFFDANGDAYIDVDEIEAAAEILVGRGSRFTRDCCGFEVPEFDHNNNNVMDDDEIDEMAAVLADPDAHVLKKRSIEERLCWFPMADFIFQSVPRPTETYIDKLADANDDGRIDEIEQKIIETGLSSQHNVEHYFDAAIDRNKDGFVNWSELYIILQSSAKDWGLIVLAEPPYPAHTPTDRLLDISGDGLIDEEEVKTHVILFSGQPAAANFITPELKEILDRDKNGEISQQEIQTVKAAIFYPRQVDTSRPREVQSDKDENGYLDVVEVGILAGEVAGTPITPFDDRINLYQLKGSCNQDDGKFKTLLPGKGKSASVTYLAVLDVELGLSSIEKEQVKMITTFVENAFVTLSSVSIVERRNLEKLIDEIELQYSGLLDEETAGFS